MATVEAHQAQSATVEMLLGSMVCYQKHKPGRNLSLDRLPNGYFQITSIHQFGNRIIFNDGVIVMEGDPTVMCRKGRLALLLPTGEELYFFVQ